VHHVWQRNLRPGLFGASPIMVLALAILLLLAVASSVTSARSAPAPARHASMPDPCVSAPNLPFCK
jgi:hypothetical protein